jgi:hypothetical protein
MDFLLNDLLTNNSFLAQILHDVDIMQDMSDTWNNFIETGQVWAFLIGIFFGYIFAKFTTF